ncbi:ASCH domain-containing protein [Sporosarcina aquimarina]|uniref:ASCH domain-containing protein n=1 Tax=Sporosarcina aquimarina TaxID=114975 RepID=UPI00203A3AD7|nr:ASCH domain-containing protein [Sporosarcina aquimarina]MCM3757716.1 ASCH domain-containing protein [Sporosarcina aquimarina]
MEHAMGLYEAPFNSIKSGRKTVEVRLYDEKRRKLGLGDIIRFTKLPDSKETVTVEVIELNKYPTFKELYESIPARDFDAVGSSIDERVERIHHIYTPKEEEKWGTLAIAIKLC